MFLKTRNWFKQRFSWKIGILFFVISLIGFIITTVLNLQYDMTQSYGVPKPYFFFIIMTLGGSLLFSLIFFIIGGFLGKFFKYHWVAVLSTASIIFLNLYLIDGSHLYFLYSYSISVPLFITLPLAGILIAIDITNPYWIRGLCLGPSYLLLPIGIFYNVGIGVHIFAIILSVILSTISGIAGLAIGIMIDVYKRKEESIERRPFLWAFINLMILLSSYLLIYSPFLFLKLASRIIEV